MNTDIDDGIDSHVNNITTTYHNNNNFGKHYIINAAYLYRKHIKMEENIAILIIVLYAILGVYITVMYCNIVNDTTRLPIL